MYPAIAPPEASYALKTLATRTHLVRNSDSDRVCGFGVGVGFRVGLAVRAGIWFRGRFRVGSRLGLRLGCGGLGLR